MAKPATAKDLETLLGLALAIADDLALWSVGARLDQALVDLTGNGRDINARPARSALSSKS